MPSSPRKRAGTKPNMGSCRNPETGCLDSLHAIICAYCSEALQLLQREREHWANHADLKSAVRTAALSEYPRGKRHGHQRRFKRETLWLAADKLYEVSLPIDGPFGDLHEAVRAAIGGIHGIGELAVYDIASRIGAYLRVEPDRVYLHAGARVGARALGFRGDTIRKSELPSAFMRLSCAEIEDCLCVYKKNFKHLADARSRLSNS